MRGLRWIIQTLSLDEFQLTRVASIVSVCLWNLNA